MSNHKSNKVSSSLYLSHICKEKKLFWIQGFPIKSPCLSCMGVILRSYRSLPKCYNFVRFVHRHVFPSTSAYKIVQKNLSSRLTRKTKAQFPWLMTMQRRTHQPSPVASSSSLIKISPSEITDFCDQLESYQCNCIYDSSTIELQVLRKVNPILANVLCVEDWDTVQEEANQSYPWTFENLEISLFVEGKFQVLLEGANDILTLERGDIVIFPKGAIGQVTILEQCRRRSLVCTEVEWNTRFHCALDALKSIEDDKQWLKSERMKQRFRNKETFPTWVGFVLADLIQLGAAFSIFYFWDNGPGTFIKNHILVFILKKLIIPFGMLSVFLSILGHLYIGIEPHISNARLKNGIENIFYFLAPSNIIVEKIKQQMKEEENKTETWDNL
ncbi:hypothetical protein Gasu_46610 isoform 1 [Galdieria sulphuraria]|uniref:(S)-ureidoglycine aminohydrolase cupin domain-containing protein n=1 Tax=Galdieria sulphuraria TaxID=130081 RepID=M2XWP9_GALSU|nr:hypothetical protein Gasu_46610 isoform 1 [Galdieria sulphuraria]EME27839.1 hypothetical protein isoform 1 [Galdieria sulphuraria]|eukprot:XP_005704359.1 hypothetical protein isoform 1 [Galdieria sulphuraria]